MGLKTWSTSTVSMVLTGMERIAPVYAVIVIFHCARCFWLLHWLDMPARNSAAHSAKVGTNSSLWRASMGFTPLATLARQPSASLRASARLTAEVPPKPISRGRPPNRNRNTHCFEPPLLTTRYSPPPSAKRPGFPSAKTSLEFSLRTFHVHLPQDLPQLSTWIVPHVRGCEQTMGVDFWRFLSVIRTVLDGGEQGLGREVFRQDPTGRTCR